MRAYWTSLREADFRSLFLGATVSSLGDGMSFVALAWLVVSRPGGTAQLGLLVALYTAPVIVGGWLAAYILDRFDKRRVIAVDCAVRGVAFASIPITAAIGAHVDGLVFVVATIYGLLKMIPLAGFASAIPELVDDRNLDAANALEGLSYGVAGVIGPAIAGVLINVIGASDVLLIDAASYFLFGAAATAVRRPLRSRPDAGAPRPAGLVDAVRVLVHDLPITSTTIAFMAFNVAEGMLLVVAPWLARERLGGSAALGLLLSCLSAGELAGSFVAGTRAIRRPLVAIGGVELLATLGFAFLYASPTKALVATGFAIVGFFSSPMTVWAQSMRMRRIPAEYRGRAFATLRTLMQATPPVGAALAAPLLAAGMFTVAVGTMIGLAAIPAVAILGVGTRTEATPCA